jgi:hypothetical protein
VTAATYFASPAQVVIAAPRWPLQQTQLRDKG